MLQGSGGIVQVVVFTIVLQEQRFQDRLLPRGIYIGELKELIEGIRVFLQQGLDQEKWRARIQQPPQRPRISQPVLQPTWQASTHGAKAVVGRVARWIWRGWWKTTTCHSDRIIIIARFFVCHCSCEKLRRWMNRSSSAGWNNSG